MLCSIFLIARQQLQHFNVVFSLPPVASFVTVFVASDVRFITDASAGSYSHVIYKSQINLDGSHLRGGLLLYNTDKMRV